MVQTIVSLENNRPNYPTLEMRARALSKTEGTEGLSIDRKNDSAGMPYLYPYYGVNNTGVTLANARFGSLTSGSLKVDALIGDSPRAENLPIGNTLEFTFETYAIAIDGRDKGTYYGSVSWGFKFDAQGNFLDKSLSSVSKGRPTANFLAAAKKWNSQKFMINGILTPTVPLPLK